MPCATLRCLLHSPPGSRQVLHDVATSVQVARTEPTHRSSIAHRNNYSTASIFRDGSDGGFRMGRHRQPVEIRSDLFHRRRDVELVTEELRLNCAHGHAIQTIAS